MNAPRAHARRGVAPWMWTVIALTIIAYLPAVRAPYAFDDISAIPGNASIRRLTPLSVPLSPPANTAVAGRPLVNVTLALNYRLNEWLGVDQRPYPLGRNKTITFHLVNLTIHCLSSKSNTDTSNNVLVRKIFPVRQFNRNS